MTAQGREARDKQQCTATQANKQRSGKVIEQQAASGSVLVPPPNDKGVGVPSKRFYFPLVNENRPKTLERVGFSVAPRRRYAAILTLGFWPGRS